MIAALLGPLKPYLLGARLFLYASVALAIFGGGFWMGAQRGDAKAAQAMLTCSQTLARQSSDAIKLQAARDAAAADSLSKVVADVQASEKARQTLAAQNASLAQANAKLSADLGRSNAALGVLKSRIAGYVAGGPGSDTAACAAVAGRARVLGDLFGQSLGLLQQASDLLATGQGLAGEGAAISADAAAVADQLGAVVRGWQDRYRAVEQAK
jgi:hypothetical protein